MAGGFSEEEEKFYEKIYSIERVGFWKGFVVGFVIQTAITAVIAVAIIAYIH